MITILSYLQRNTYLTAYLLLRHTSLWSVWSRTITVITAFDVAQLTQFIHMHLNLNCLLFAVYSCVGTTYRKTRCLPWMPPARLLVSGFQICFYVEVLSSGQIQITEGVTWHETQLRTTMQHLALFLCSVASLMRLMELSLCLSQLLRPLCGRLIWILSQRWR